MNDLFDAIGEILGSLFAAILHPTCLIWLFAILLIGLLTVVLVGS